MIGQEMSVPHATVPREINIHDYSTRGIISACYLLYLHSWPIDNPAAFQEFFCDHVQYNYRCVVTLYGYRLRSRNIACIA